MNKGKMGRFFSVIFMTGFVFCCLVGSAATDSSQNYIGYMVGKNSTLEDDGSGTLVMTITGLDSNYYDESGGMPHLYPVDYLRMYTYPMKGGVVVIGDTGQMQAVVNITDISFSDNSSTAVLTMEQTGPSEGSHIDAMFPNQTALDLNLAGNQSSASVYFEFVKGPAQFPNPDKMKEYFTSSHNDAAPELAAYFPGNFTGTYDYDSFSLHGDVFTFSLNQENGIVSGTGTENGTALNLTGQILSDISGYITGREIGLIKTYPYDGHSVLYYGTYRPDTREIKGEWKSVNYSGTFDMSMA